MSKKNNFIFQSPVNKQSNTIIWNNNNINGNININNNYSGENLSSMNLLKTSGNLNYKNNNNSILSQNYSQFKQIKLGGASNNTLNNSINNFNDIKKARANIKQKKSYADINYTKYSTKTEGNDIDMTHAKNYINYLYEHLDTSYNANTELSSKTDMIINMKKNIESEIKKNNEIYKSLILSYNDKLKMNNKYKNDFINFLNLYKTQFKAFNNEITTKKKELDSITKKNNAMKKELQSTEDIINYLKTTEDILTNNQILKNNANIKDNEEVNEIDYLKKEVNKLKEIKDIGIKNLEEKSLENKILKEKLEELESKVKNDNNSNDNKKIRNKKFIIDGNRYKKNNIDYYKKLITNENNKTKDLLKKIYNILKEKEKLKKEEIKRISKDKEEKEEKKVIIEKNQEENEEEIEISKEKKAKKKKTKKKSKIKEKERETEKDDEDIDIDINNNIEEKEKEIKEESNPKIKKKKKKSKRISSEKEYKEEKIIKENNQESSYVSYTSKKSQNKEPKKDEAFPQNSLSMDEISSIMSSQKKLSQTQESIFDILMTPLKGSYLYSITDKGKLLSFNITHKKFAIIDSGLIDGWTSFIPNYLKNIEGSLLLNTLEGLFIITGSNYNDLYFYSQEKCLIAKITTFKYSHKYGGLLLSPSPDNNLFAIGGDNETNEVELLSFEDDQNKSLPKLLSRRINSSYTFINSKLYAIFGKDNNTIECLNIRKMKNKWNKIEYNMDQGQINNIYGHVSLPVHDNNILIVGGKNNQKMMVLDLDEKSLDITDIKIPFIDVVGEYIFDKEKFFNQTVNEEKKDQDGKNIKQLIGMDTHGNVHLFDYNFNYVVLLIKNNSNNLNNNENNEK